MSEASQITLRKPMPYSRDALDMIRRGACAYDLGWDEGFYERICRKHGLQTCRGPILQPLDPPKINKAGPEDAITALNAKWWAADESKDICFSWVDGFGRYSDQRTMDRRTAALMVLLADSKGCPVKRSALALKLPRHPEQSWGRIRTSLRRALVGTPIDVLNKMGYTGGYYLCFAATGTPCAVHIVSIGDYHFGPQVEDTA